jgi:uncharacterized protein YndB with AHSA1/START domain
MKDEPFIIERIFNVPAEKIWKAITDKEEMKQWYFDLAEFKCVVGFEFQFYAGDDKKKWLHICKITEVVLEKKLSYSWRYDGYSGIPFVSFELFPVENASDKFSNKTRLKLTHSGLESFPGDSVPELKKENFADGWTQIIGSSLQEFLKKPI